MSVFTIREIVLSRAQMHLISVYSFKYMRAESWIIFFIENETFSKNTALKNTAKTKKKDKKCTNMYILPWKVGNIYDPYLQNLYVSLSKTCLKELVQEQWEQRKMLHNATAIF